MKPSLTQGLEQQCFSFCTIPEGGGMWSSGSPSALVVKAHQEAVC